MATNLALDDKLIEEARRAGKHKTKKSAVTAALAEYIQRRKQLRILEASAALSSIQRMTTKLGGAGSVHDGAGGHPSLVAGTSPQIH